MNDDKAHNPGFNVPNGYFESLEEDLFIRMAEAELPSHPGFVIPLGYLKHLDDKIMQEAKASDTRVISITPYQRWTYAIGIAASFMLVWLAIKPGGNLTGSATLPLTEVDAYIQNGGLSIEASDLAQLLTDEDVDYLTSNPVFSAESLETYLLNNLDEATYLNE